jgi:glycosyltransferase involved in cell wall biosynthesis
LPELIKSVQNQTYSNWELIIVDDCSNDSLQVQQLLKALNDSRIRYFRHATNLNGAQARNTGLKECNGEYVAFLDSDDIWHEQKLSVQLQQLLATSNPQNSFLYGALQKIYSGKKDRDCLLPERGKKPTESVSDYLFVYKGLMQTSTFFLPAALAKRIAFNPNLKRHQDYDFVLRAEHLGVEFYFTEQPLCSWICLAGEENVSKKGCKLAFAIEWFKEYQQYMTATGRDAYLSKQMFYIAVKSNQLIDYYRFLGREFGVSKLVKVVLANIQFVVKKG